MVSTLPVVGSVPLCSDLYSPCSGLYSHCSGLYLPCSGIYLPLQWSGLYPPCNGIYLPLQCSQPRLQWALFLSAVVSIPPAVASIPTAVVSLLPAVVFLPSAVVSNLPAVGSVPLCSGLYSLVIGDDCRVKKFREDLGSLQGG